MTIVNAHEFMMLAHSSRPIPMLNELSGKYRDGVTDKQKAFLRSMGIGVAQIKYKGQASVVINLAIKRRDYGLATPGQMRALAAAGVKNVNMITYKQAFQILGAEGGNYETL